MEFSWIAALITILVWVVEAIVSISEGTFSRKQWRRMHMSFCWNWAVSMGDGVIFPIVNGLIVGQTKTMWWVAYIPLVVLGLFISFIAHKAWWRKDENLGHVFASWEASTSPGDYGSRADWWYKDVTKAGWIHFVFMAVQITIVGLYMIIPMNYVTVVLITALLGIFLGIQTAQAIVVQKAKDSQKAVNLYYMELVVLVVMMITKLR